MGFFTIQSLKSTHYNMNLQEGVWETLIFYSVPFRTPFLCPDSLRFVVLFWFLFVIPACFLGSSLGAREACWLGSATLLDLDYFRYEQVL